MSESQTPANGIHHIAFCTRDIDATYDYYNNKLGMPLVHCENHLHGDDGWFRHFFFDMGAGQCLGFFAVHNAGEKPGYQTNLHKSAGLPVWVNHTSFRVDSIADLEKLRRRFLDAGVKLDAVIKHGWCTSLYLHDPNGLTIEFTADTDNFAEQFDQTHDEAYALLTQSPDEFESVKDSYLDPSEPIA